MSSNIIHMDGDKHVITVGGLDFWVDKERDMHPHQSQYYQLCQQQHRGEYNLDVDKNFVSVEGVERYIRRQLKGFATSILKELK